MSKIIGIDLGTTNSVVAVMEGGEAKVITKSIKSNHLFEIVHFAIGSAKAQGLIFGAFHLCTIDVGKFTTCQRACRTCTLPDFGGLYGG